ncbi:MAG TPA: hypothetical protein VFA41_02655 [Ktedonobacteraceae bacterium]|nr:hypothetical protein [Ktedonobacteraceae bacterium]
MATTLAEKKVEIVNDVEEATKGSRKWWLIVPVAVLAVAGGAFLVVRRFISSN